MNDPDAIERFLRQRRISRRAFLVRSAMAGLGLGAAGITLAGLLAQQQRSPWRAGVFAPIGRSQVAVLPAASYDAELERVVLDGLDLLGVDVRGASVLLKPNMVEFDPGSAINTDPRLVAATAIAMHRSGARRVVVGEGSGHRRDIQYILGRSGLRELLSDADTTFVDLNTAAIRRVSLDSHYTELGELWLPDAVVSADIVVSMPKMKTHHWGGVTLSLKNCFGVVPGRVYGWPKNVLHWAGLRNSILDVAAAVRPDLAIVDGITGMQGDGPIKGEPVSAGVVVMGTDPVAVDATAAYLMGIDGEKVGYLAEAGRFLGQHRLDEIDQLADGLDDRRTNFALLPQFEYLRLGSGRDAPDSSDGEPPA